jgi:hypothetical protein
MRLTLYWVVLRDKPKYCEKIEVFRVQSKILRNVPQNLGARADKSNQQSIFECNAQDRFRRAGRPWRPPFHDEPKSWLLG